MRRQLRPAFEAMASPAARLVLVIVLVAACCVPGAGGYAQQRPHQRPAAVRGAPPAGAAHGTARDPADPPAAAGGDYGAEAATGEAGTGATAPAPPHAARRQRAHRSGGRCTGAEGAWCGGYYGQPPAPRRRPPVLGRPCPRGCGAAGVCHGDRGACDCPAGAGGPACGDADKRPCTNGFRLPRNASSPKGHIGADRRDLDWLAAGNTPSRCAAAGG